MKEMTRYGITLMVICMVAAGLLAGVNTLTKTRIIAQANAEEELSLKEVMPEAGLFQPVKIKDEIVYYRALDDQGKLIGVAFKAAAKGYSSVIETMVGMKPDGEITLIKVLAQNETPGLGSKVAEPDFTGQFSRKTDLNDVQTIAGATISSRAVINSINKKIQEVKELLKNES